MQEDQRLADLINRCKKDDALAQKSIFDKYKDKLFAVCLRYASSYADAEDMLIEGYTRIFKNISSFEVKDSNTIMTCESWTVKVIVNTAINMYKVNKRAQMETFDEQIQSQDEKDMSFSTDYIYSEEELITTIQKLTPQLKIIFNLYAIEERSI